MRMISQTLDMGGTYVVTIGNIPTYEVVPGSSKWEIPAEGGIPQIT
jgi:hypothetical protein